MQLRLKTKFTLTVSLLVLGVATVLSAVYVATLLQQELQQAEERAQYVVRQVFFQAQQALEDAAAEGRAPAGPTAENLREYVRTVLEEDAGVTRMVSGAAEVQTIYEVTVTDHRGIALVSSDASLPGRSIAPRTPLSALLEASVWQQIQSVYGPPQVFEIQQPFNIGGGGLFGYVRVAISTSLLREKLRREIPQAALLALGAVAVSTLLAAVVSHLALAPLSKISEQLDRIAQGQFDFEPLRRHDELGLVSTKITQLSLQLRERTLLTQEERSLERIRAQMQVLDRLAGLARITAGAAHEVKNPLNSMRLWLENLKSSGTGNPEMQQRAIQILDKEIDRLDRVVKRLLDFYRPVELLLEETRLDELLQQALELVQPQIEKSQVDLITRLETEIPPIRVDRELLKQAVLNLLLNACEAMPSGGRLTVELKRTKNTAEIIVRDTGLGIPDEHRERIFQLFFTTKAGGSGVGLATAYRIVMLHNGSLDFTSEAGRGTAFRIQLPLDG
jgi:signal transduction histidine kinase